MAIWTNKRTRVGADHGRGVEHGDVTGLVNAAHPGQVFVATAQWHDAMPHWKRVLDILGATIGIVFLLPLFACIALYVHLVSSGPVLFRQTRIGYRGLPFTCWKFRSMHLQHDDQQYRAYVAALITSGGAMTKLDDRYDHRLIPLGRVFRASCLDELPQLFCVLRGTMSLVGPRPCLPHEYEAYRPEHCARLDAVPGLSGLWQVSGKNRTTFEEMVALDCRYAASKSLRRDLGILLKTGSVIVRQLSSLSKAEGGA